MPRKINKNAPYEGSSSFSIRSNDGKGLIEKFRSNQLEIYGGPKGFLNDPQNSYWKKYDAGSFANGWQRCRIKALTKPDSELMEETAKLAAKLEERLLEPPPMSMQGPTKRSYDDFLNDNQPVQPPVGVTSSKNKALFASNSMIQHYQFSPPYDMCITTCERSKGRQVVLRALLPTGIAKNTTDNLNYKIEDSPDGLKSVLVLEGIMPSMIQNPTLAEKTYEDRIKTPDWSRAMQALKDVRRDRVAKEQDELQCVARFDLGIKVPAKIEPKWVHFFGKEPSGERYLTFIIPELMSEDVYIRPPTKTVALYESDENDVVEKNDLDDDDF